MQAGTEFAMESCSRLGFARGEAVSLRDPVDQGQGLAGRGHAFAGGTLGGRSLRHRGAGPVLLWVQKGGNEVRTVQQSIHVNETKAEVDARVSVCTLGSGPAWFSFWGRFCLLWESARDM